MTMKIILRRALLMIAAAIAAPWISMLAWATFTYRKRDLTELADELTAGLRQAETATMTEHASVEVIEPAEMAHTGTT